METKKQSFESKQIINVYPDGKDDGRSSPENVPKEEKKRKQSEFSNSAGSDVEALKRIREDSDEDEQQLTDREVKIEPKKIAPSRSRSKSPLQMLKMSGHSDKIMKAIHKKLEDCRDPNPIQLKHLHKALDKIKISKGDTSQPFLFENKPKATRSPRHSISPPSNFRSVSNLKPQKSSASHLVDLNRRLTVLSNSKEKIEYVSEKNSHHHSYLGDRSLLKVEARKASSRFRSKLGDSKNSIERRTFDANFEDKKIEKLNHLFTRCFGSKGRITETSLQKEDLETRPQPKRNLQGALEGSERRRNPSKSKSLDKREDLSCKNIIPIGELVKEAASQSRENKRNTAGKKRQFYTSEDLNNNSSNLFSEAVREKLKNTSIDAEDQIFRTHTEIRFPTEKRNNVQMILEKTKQLGLISNSGKMSVNFLSGSKTSKLIKEPELKFKSQTKLSSKAATTTDFQLRMPEFEHRKEHINSKIDPFLFDKTSKKVGDKSYTRNYMMKTTYHTSKEQKQPYDQSNSSLSKQTSKDLRFRAKDASQAFLQLKKKMAPTIKFP